MAPDQFQLRFAHQDEHTLSLLARIQRETGYVPTMEELSQLLQCPSTPIARQRLREMVDSGEGTRLSPTEQQEVAEIAERLLRKETPCAQRRQSEGHHRQRIHATGHAHVQWARSREREVVDCDAV